MKSKVDNLLEDVFRAYYKARENKRNTRSQLEFEDNLEENLIDLYHEIKNGEYLPGKSICFIVQKPVKREVFASQFRDRVVHHLVFNWIAPIFEKHFIHDSYSCRKGKGTLFGINRADHHMRACSQNYTKPAYILKLDIQGYFMNINKVILRKIVFDKLNKEWALNPPKYSVEIATQLINAIIEKDPTKNCALRGSRKDWEGLPASKSLFNRDEMVGLPIGDLTSQLFSDIYLNEFDQYVKRELKMKHYGRYVDDFFIVSNDRAELVGLIPKVRCFLKERLGLTLHPKKMYLQDVKNGVAFLGAVIKPFRQYAAERSVNNMKLRVAAFDRSCAAAGWRMSNESLVLMLVVINSYLGYVSKYKTYRIKFGLLVRFRKIFDMFRYPINLTKVVMRVRRLFVNIYAVNRFEAQAC